MSGFSPDSCYLPEGSSSLSAASITASMLKPSHASTTAHMSSSRCETSGGEPLGACMQPAQVQAITQEAVSAIRNPSSSGTSLDAIHCIVQQVMITPCANQTCETTRQDHCMLLTRNVVVMRHQRS